MRIMKALLVVLFASFATAGFAAGDTAKCDKLTGAEKEKCLADARK
ncbi:MAG: hypothetical protein KJ025_12390 [Burkholderiales bacterium]|nr:hypothetical protein [Burkholderiales bacterium]